MPVEHTPFSPAELGATLTPLIGPGAPTALRIMVARGLVPMGPRDLASSLYALSLDDEEAVVQAANRTAVELPDRVLEGALKELLDPRVLDYFSRRMLGRAPLLELLILNPRTDDQTIRFLAATCGERQLEVIAVNEQRILRCPQILEALYFNRRARMSTVDRLVELAARNGVTCAAIPQFRAIADALSDRPPPPREPAAAAAAARAVTIAQADPLAAREALVLEPMVLDIDQAFAEIGERNDEGWAGEEFLHEEGEDLRGLSSVESDGFEEGEHDEDLLSAEFEMSGDAAAADQEANRRRIEGLPITARIRLATIGNSFHRQVLIRDANKLVAMAAIKSPGLSDMEAVRYASNPNLSEDVLRYIATNRDLLKLYTVKVNLVNNAKVPLALTIGLVPHLRMSHLKQLAKSKNVPSALAAQARKLVQAKTAQQGGGGD